MEFNIQKMMFLASCAAAFIFTACGSDSSSANDQDYSSSLQSLSSSSGTEIPSSSSEVENFLSSSIGANASSASSGSEEASSSSFSSGSEVSSSSGKANWAYLNPNISYGEFTDVRDGQAYKTTVIGTQTWMAENLNYADSVSTTSLADKSWCYNNNADSCAKYGRLYTWAAAIDSVSLANDGIKCGYGVTTCTLPSPVRGICPEGWHLLTKSEMDTLSNFVYTDQGLSLNRVDTYLGTYLKAADGWNTHVGVATGTDVYGFSALPAGFRSNDGNFYNTGYNTFFWSASENDSYFAYDNYFVYTNEGFYRDRDYKSNGFSVRCLQD